MTRPISRARPLALLLAVTLAQSPVLASDATDIATLRAQLEKQVRELAEQQQRLDAELKKVQAAQRRLEALNRAEAPSSPGRSAALDTPPMPRETQNLYRGGQDDTQLEVATVFAQPSILTPPGQFVFEPSMQYSFSSSDRVSIIGYSVLNAVLIGLIDVRTVNRNNWTLGLGGRYGLTNRVEIEARVPYVYRTDDTISRPINISASATDQRFSADGGGLGDAEFGVRYQLNVPSGDSPFYIAGARIKTRTGTGPYDVTYVNDTGVRGTFPTELPTGTGFYSFQGSLSAVLPADPAVFFGGVNYLWNVKDDINRFIVPQTINPSTGMPEGGVFIGEVDPGDSLGLNFGMGIALNERSSFSVGYEHTWVNKTEVDGQTAPNSLSAQLGTLQVGFSYRLNKQSTLNLSIGAGVTDDAPDATITLRLPYRF